MNYVLPLLVYLLVGCANLAYADEVYQEEEAFLAGSFGGNPPGSQTLWIKKTWRDDISGIMQRRFSLLKTKYWRDGSRTAWILEEIGKYKPITTGIVIDNHAIQQVKVLIYRESHGWEVKYPFFTDQFKNAKLENDHTLTESIDNISGATMSVNALRNLSELALYLHAKVLADDGN